MCHSTPPSFFSGLLLACACLHSCAPFSPRFSLLFWLLNIAAPLSNSCTAHSCQVRSLYFHYFLSTALCFPDWFDTHSCFDTKLVSWSLFPDFVAGWIQMLNNEGCSSLGHNKPLLQSFLFLSSKNRGIMRKNTQIWSKNKQMQMFTHCSAASIDHWLEALEQFVCFKFNSCSFKRNVRKSLKSVQIVVMQVSLSQSKEIKRY